MFFFIEDERRRNINDPIIGNINTQNTQNSGFFIIDQFFFNRNSEIIKIVIEQIIIA